MSFAAGIAAALLSILGATAILVLARSGPRLRRKWRDRDVRNPIIKDWNS